jgi:hypothetical protein
MHRLVWTTLRPSPRRAVAAALVLLTVGLCACRPGSARLEGKWKGRSADGVSPEAQSAATSFASDTEIDVRGDAITVITPRDKQSGTYKVVKEDRSQVSIVTDKDGPTDVQTFTFVDDKTMKWNVVDGKTITFTRER